MQVCRRLAKQAAFARLVDTKAFTKQASQGHHVPTDAILLKGLQFFGYHGVLKEVPSHRLRHFDSASVRQD